MAQTKEYAIPSARGGKNEAPLPMSGQGCFVPHMPPARPAAEVRGRGRREVRREERGGGREGRRAANRSPCRISFHRGSCPGGPTAPTSGRGQHIDDK